MRVSLIAAMAENRVIGRAGGVPWHIPGDLRFFKSATMGKPVIMGRKTFASLPGLLPGRPHIVISRRPSLKIEGATVVDSLDRALAAAEAMGAEEAMVIGGEEIFRLALPRAGRIYLTEVHEHVEGDTRMPEWDPGAWCEVSREDREPNGPGGPAYSIVVLERRSRPGAG